MKRRVVLVFKRIAIALILISLITLTACTPKSTIVSNNRDYEWYIDQGDTGVARGSNCGPSSVAMVAKWYDKDFSVTSEQMRTEMTPGDYGWWYTTTISNSLMHYNIPFVLDYMKKVSEENIINEIDKGNIIILCIDTTYLTYESDMNSHYGKFYSYSGGHFLIVKGYEITKDNTYFEVYDPNSFGSLYENGDNMGKDRYYLSQELVLSANNWWNYYISIQAPVG